MIDEWDKAKDELNRFLRTKAGILGYLYPR